MSNSKPTLKQRRKEAIAFFDGAVRKKFIETYDHLAKSGAVDKQELIDSNFIFPKCVVVITAQDFVPLSDAAEKMLANLKHF